jgi:hypothetical protein
MIIAFVTVIAAGVAAPFIAFAFAMQHRQCPHCGMSVTPDPALVRAFIGD